VSIYDGALWCSQAIRQKPLCCVPQFFQGWSFYAFSAVFATPVLWNFNTSIMFAWKTQKRRWEWGKGGERILKSREGQRGTRKQIERNIKETVSQDYTRLFFLFCVTSVTSVLRGLK
jgi:hypothetical protein